MKWSIPPFVLRVRRSGWPAIWLPLVLLWPLVFLAFCVALPVCLVSTSPNGSPLHTLIAAYRTICAVHGTKLELSSTQHGRWSFALY
jgi:hypothetical protein